jgi:hypothetical protein
LHCKGPPGPFRVFAAYSLEYVLGGGVRVASRPRQTDSKSSIFLGREVLQFPLKSVPNDTDLSK